MHLTKPVKAMYFSTRNNPEPCAIGSFLPVSQREINSLTYLEIQMAFGISLLITVPADQDEKLHCV
jgi:hypothetical protein